METTNVKNRNIKRFRKNIDLRSDTKQALSLQAVQHGMSLKSYIETMLDSLAEMEEDKILSALSNVPDAKTVLTGAELEEFERELKSW